MARHPSPARRRTRSPRSGRDRGRISQDRKRVAADLSPPRLTAGDFFFRALVILSSFEFVALLMDMLRHPAAEGTPSGAPLIFRIFLGFLVAPLAVLVAGLIIWRAPRNAVGRYLLLYAIGFTGWQFSYQLPTPLASTVAFIVFYAYWGSVGLPSLLYLLVSFPNGRPYTPRIAAAVTAYAVIKVAGAVLEAVSITPGVGFVGNLLPVNPFLVTWLSPAGAWIGPLIGSQSILLFVGIAAAIALLVLRYRNSDARHRQQIKWLAWSGLVMAFVLLVYAYLHFLKSPQPAGSYFVVFDLFAYASISALPVLAVGIAILRHRLLDVDLILNRTLVYGPLTAIVAGLIAASSRLFQTSFVTATGLDSDTATVLTTLFVVAAFTPVRNRLQGFVDRFFKEGIPAQRVGALSDRLQGEISILDPVRTTRLVLEETVRAFDAEGGIARLRHAGRWKPVHHVGDGKAKLVQYVEIQSGNRRIGEILLGRRRNGGLYSESDQEALRSLGEAVGKALTAERKRS